MSHCNHVQQVFADYHDGHLDEDKLQEVAEHLSMCPGCRAVDSDYRRAVRLLQDMPMPEPLLDMWPEFAAKMDAVEAEMRLNPAVRLSRWWNRAVDRFAEGVVLYTHAVAQRYLGRSGEVSDS